MNTDTFVLVVAQFVVFYLLVRTSRTLMLYEMFILFILERLVFDDVASQQPPPVPWSWFQLQKEFGAVP